MLLESARRLQHAALAALVLVGMCACSSTESVAHSTTYPPPTAGIRSVGDTLVFPSLGGSELLRLTYRALPPSAPLRRSVHVPAGSTGHVVVVACRADDSDRTLTYTIYAGRGEEHPAETGDIRCDGVRERYVSSERLPRLTSVALSGDLEGVTGAYVVLERIG